LSVYIDNFETIFGVKNNIQGLRNKVLELAIQGKLVEQDPNDEPASELLKKIKAERERLVKEGKIKKQKALAPIAEDEIPFEVPELWEWVRLDTVIDMIYGGGTPDKSNSKFWNGDIKWASVKDLSDSDMFLNDTVDSITDEGLSKSSSKIVNKGDFIISTRMGLGRIVISNIDVAINQDLKGIVLTSYFSNKLFYYFYKTLEIKGTGTTVKGIKQDELINILIPLPPLQEQHRIVKKVESLMTQIDKLEESLQKKQHLMGNLPKAVVDAIGSCQTGEELKEKLQFVVDNFETVFQTPESMQELRNVILQLAIEGKLVPQDNSDEPASELLKRIQAERDRLLKEGKIKKQKAMAPIEEDEVPFEVPESWEWVRLEVLSDINPRNIIDDNLDVSFIPMKLMDDGYGSSHRSEIKKWKELKSGYTHFAENDIAIAKITPCFENRKSAILTNLESGFGAGTTEFHIIRVFSDLVSRQYILSIFKTQWVIKAGTNTFTGTAGQQRVSTDFIKEFAIPLPPLAEQHRIVQKVESLMCLIDEMENKLKLKSDLVEKMADV
jgi:type I restriction enzyme, S subunit